MQKKTEKSCKRKKCPYYTQPMAKCCELCEWNKTGGVWIADKKGGKG